MSKEDPTPPRDLHTPPNPQLPQQATEDSTSDEDNVPDIWSEELFPLNILPFSDNDDYNSDPTYSASNHPSTTESDDDEEDDDPATNEEVSEEETAEETDDPDDNMNQAQAQAQANPCLLYTSPSPRD